MRFEEGDLVQDLYVLTAVELGAEVLVSVYGGRANVCGTVRFTFDDAGERGKALRVLRRWAKADAAVSLLSSGDKLSLFSERTAFDRALA